MPTGDPTHGDVATLYKMDAIDLNRTQQIKSANIASTGFILSKSLRNPPLHCVHGVRLHKPTFVSAAHGQLSLAFMGAHPPILLGTLGMTDTLILMVMALVVFGPRRLPQIGRQIGKLMYEFRKASNDFKFQMEEELRLSEEADRRKKEEERQRSLAALAAPNKHQSPPIRRRRHKPSHRPIQAKALIRPSTRLKLLRRQPRRLFHASCRPRSARPSQPRGRDILQNQIWKLRQRLLKQRRFKPIRMPLNPHQTGAAPLIPRRP